MAKAKKSQASRTNLTPYLRGIAIGLFLAGYTLSEIAQEIEKPDGSNPCYQSIATLVDQAQSHGIFQWSGDGEKVNAGRPRITTDALDRAIEKEVFKNRGSAKVTVDHIRKVVKGARKISKSTVARRLGEAGLRWLRRRRKTLVPQAHKQSRLEWAAWTLGRTAATLARWAYTDGTVFYLANSESTREWNNRGALGTMVWRMADGSDALFEDCVGPSAYWKAQGLPVRVWGLLVAGILFVSVLPEGECMNREWYTWLIHNRFPGWLRKALGRNKYNAGAYLLQDHERCLWTEEPVEAMEDEGITLLDNFPKCSQDLNPVEVAWRELRARLFQTQPIGRETRDAFICRLRSAVGWVNRNRKPLFKEICCAQKAWARDVLNANPPGSRTKH